VPGDPNIEHRGLRFVRHLAVAVCAGLLLGLLPASALGFDPANLDQENIPGGTDKSAPAEVLLCQTFTAGKSGTLVEVDLDIAGHGEPLATVEIRATDPATGLPTGGPLATSSASLPIDFTWLHLVFTPPLGVTSGTKYAIILISNDETRVAASDDVYAGGEALFNTGSWSDLSSIYTGMADLGFETFVDAVTPELQWDQTSVIAGVTTPLTLTETVKFVNGNQAARYDSRLTSTLPAWFNPTGITCSDSAAEIAPADCTIASFETGFSDHIHSTIGGDLVTIKLTGTADPATSEVGRGSVSAEGCIGYSADGPAPSGACATTAAYITVAGPAAAPTQPASPTSGSSSRGCGSMLWFLPILLVAALVGFLGLALRRRRPIA
jgi:hypothetical protein